MFLKCDAIFDNKLVRDDDTIIILICDFTKIIKIEWCF